MTYLEKALENNPHLKPLRVVVENCPADFCLEPDGPCAAVDSACDPSYDICSECWRREVPHE